MTNRSKREKCSLDLESKFILRFPPEPAKRLRNALKNGECLKNRLSIRVNDDMRSGEVCLDHWVMNAKIVDCPAVVGSMRKINNKTIYSAGYLFQMMICKIQPDQPSDEDYKSICEPLAKKKQDFYKLDDKIFWPHMIAPPSPNLRKRCFTKTLSNRPKAPEIQKEEEKQLLLNTDNVSISTEITKEQDDLNPKQEPEKEGPKEKKSKNDRTTTCDSTYYAAIPESSNVSDEFEGTLKDHNKRDEKIDMDCVDSHLSDIKANLGIDESSSKKDSLPRELEFDMPHSPEEDNSENSRAVQLEILDVSRFYWFLR